MDFLILKGFYYDKKNFKLIMRKFSGYTLIEVLVSILLLAFCVLFIISIFPTSSEALKQAENIEVASSLAHQQLDAVNKTSFAAINTFSGPNYYYLYSGFKNGVNYTQKFFYSATVTPVVGFSNLKDIVVNITWAEKRRPNQSIKAETIVVDSGSL